MAPLIGKPLATIADARDSEDTYTPYVVVERLLNISGEDTVTIDRKYRSAWTGKLATRFVMLTNQLPKFKDASGAIASRLVILQMTQSFFGREDHALEGRLHTELPGIFNWALAGLDRLVENGRFTVPKASDNATQLMADIASPTSAFVREQLDRKPGAEIEVDKAYHMWKEWCEKNGHYPGAKATFGRNLHSVIPELKTARPWVGTNYKTRVYAYVGIGIKSRECSGLDEDGFGPSTDGFGPGMVQDEFSTGCGGPPGQSCLVQVVLVVQAKTATSRTEASKGSRMTIARIEITMAQILDH